MSSEARDKAWDFSPSAAGSASAAAAGSAEDAEPTAESAAPAASAARSAAAEPTAAKWKPGDPSPWAASGPINIEDLVRELVGEEAGQAWHRG